MRVVFEETGEEREVVSWCRRCYDARDGDLVMIVSPAGVAHEGRWDVSDTTVCGKDATGDKWWHRP